MSPGPPPLAKTLILKQGGRGEFSISDIDDSRLAGSGSEDSADVGAIGSEDSAEVGAIGSPSGGGGVEEGFSTEDEEERPGTPCGTSP